jgi:hypothetical protein
LHAKFAHGVVVVVVVGGGDGVCVCVCVQSVKAQETLTDEAMHALGITESVAVKMTDLIGEKESSTRSGGCAVHHASVGSEAEMIEFVWEPYHAIALIILLLSKLRRAHVCDAVLVPLWCDRFGTHGSGMDDEKSVGSDHSMESASFSLDDFSNVNKNNLRVRSNVRKKEIERQEVRASLWHACLPPLAPHWFPCACRPCEKTTPRPATTSTTWYRR